MAKAGGSRRAAVIATSNHGCFPIHEVGGGLTVTAEPAGMPGRPGKTRGGLPGGEERLVAWMGGAEGWTIDPKLLVAW